MNLNPTSFLRLSSEVPLFGLEEQLFFWKNVIALYLQNSIYENTYYRHGPLKRHFID